MCARRGSGTALSTVGGISPTQTSPTPLGPHEQSGFRRRPVRGAPDRFFLLIDLTGYRANAPTGTFWDPATESMLAVAKRPKGRPGSRCEKVFRTDWKNGRAFYHPYDRVAAGGHPNWARKYPHLVWSIDCTIVDYLLQFHALLNSGNYIGI